MVFSQAACELKHSGITAGSVKFAEALPVDCGVSNREESEWTGARDDRSRGSSSGS